MSSFAQNSSLDNDHQEDGPVSSVEQLLQKYQLTVFTLAMHLLNDKRVAQNVVEEVFLILSKKDPLPTEDKELTSVIHATTYDVALAELVRIRRAKKAH